MEFPKFLVPKAEYFKEFVEREKARLPLYEKACKLSVKILQIPAPAFLKKKLKNPIWLTDMKVSPDEVFSFSLLSFFLSLLVFLPLSLINFPSTLLLLIFPPFILYNILTYPSFYCEVLRIRAANESVSIILYMVTYLSFTPVYDNAIIYAASNCHGPLGNDLKRVIWEVLSGKYTTIEDGLKARSQKWTLWNEEFVSSLSTLRLIEITPSEEGRSEVLRRSTERMLTANYKKMEEYASSLKMPLTFLLFFGVLLPLIGLVMFPLVSIFLTGYINPLYIGIGYILFLPLFLWWFLYRAISKRPGVYSHSEKIEEVEVKKYIEIKKLGVRLPIIPLAILLGFLIMLPGILYFLELYFYHSYIFSTYPSGEAAKKWQEYSSSRYSTEYVLTDALKAMSIVWGIGSAIIFATYLRTKEPYKLDLFIRKLEKDFEYGLFELHQALQYNVPAEAAILKVIQQYERVGKKESPMALFFLEVYRTLVHTVTSLQEVLFGRVGLIKKLPSSLIKNVMAIVSSALNKGTGIASNVAKNISHYLSRLGEIEDMITKSLADITSNLDMQGKFIAPFIAAIVAGASVVIIQLLLNVAEVLRSIEEMYRIGTNIGGSMSNILGMINIEQIMPPTIMEVIAGIYLIETIAIIIFFSSGINRGFNKVYREYFTCKSLIGALILFTLIFFILVTLFQPIIVQMRRV